MEMISRIADALRSYQDSSGSGGTDIMTQALYNKYVAAVKSMGGEPLSREEWIAAGKPSGV